MKKRVQNEDRVNMPLFFGFVGLFNLFLLWPGFVILHYSGVETFELPPTSKVWTIIVVSGPGIPCRDAFVFQYVKRQCWRSKLTETVKFNIVIRERLHVGIRDAPDNTPGRNRGTVLDYPSIVGWADDSQFAVFKRIVLGRRGRHGSFVPFY
jgi:hypothetical protein